jgi:hypothetical protein
MICKKGHSRVKSHQLQDRYILRMPDGWRDAIKAIAAKNRRSMNQEILTALERVVVKAATEAVSQANTSVVADRNTALQGGLPITQDERTV